MSPFRFTTKYTKSVAGLLCCLVISIQTLPICGCLLGVCPKTALGSWSVPDDVSSACHCKCRCDSKQPLDGKCCAAVDVDGSHSGHLASFAPHNPEQPCCPCECRIRRAFWALNSEVVQRNAPAELPYDACPWAITSSDFSCQFSKPTPLRLALTACQRLAWLGCWLK